MGYESRIIIVERTEHTEKQTGKTFFWPVEIAQFELGKMDYQNDAFYDVFDTEIDFDLFLPGVDEDGWEILEFKRIGPYGEHIKMCSLPALLDVLKTTEANTHIRRLPPIIAMLQAFVDGAAEWGDLRAVRYAH